MTTAPPERVLLDTDTHFLRDAPFGETPCFGGETPFHTDSGCSVDLQDADVEGIPTGLPDLTDLDRYTASPVERAATPKRPRARASTGLSVLGFLSGALFATGFWTFVFAGIDLVRNLV